MIVDFSAVKAAAEAAASEGENCVYPAATAPVFVQKTPHDHASTIPAAGEIPLSDQKECLGNPKINEGKLIAHGAANYEFKTDESSSYYVRLEDDYGVEGIKWGVDLERAITESAVQIGDRIRVQHLGSRPVTINVREKNPDTGLMSFVSKEVQRNAFEIEPLPATPTPVAAKLYDITDAAKRKRIVESKAIEEAEKKRRETAVSSSPLPPVDTAPAAPEAPPKFVPHREPVNYALKLFEAKPHPENPGLMIYTAMTMFRNATFTQVEATLLKTADSGSLAAEGMVALAADKGWSPIQIAGTSEFQSHAFHHAVRMGVAVANYSPTPDDLARLARDKLAIPGWVTSNQIAPVAPIAQPTPKNKAASPGLGF